MVKPAPRPQPRGPASEAAASNTNGTSGGARTRPRSHHAPAGVGNASGAASATPTEPPNAEQAPWTNREADLMLAEMMGNEHPRCISAYKKTPYDMFAEVRRSDGVGGQSVVLKTIPGQNLQGSNDVTPGEALRNEVADVHMVSARGPMVYDIWFSWKSPQRQYGKGRLQMPSPDEIIALRSVQRQQPQQPSYQQPQQPQQPPVGYGAPPVSNQPPYPPYGQQPPQDGGSPWPRGRHEPAPPSRDAEVSNLRAEVGEMRGALGELLEFVRGDRRAPPPPPPPPQQSQGFGAPQGERPWPRQPPPRRPYDEVEELRDELDEMRAELQSYRRAGVGMAPAAAPPVQQAARPPEPPPPTRGPNGEVYIAGVGWCIPQSRVAEMVTQPMSQPYAPPQPPPAPAPVAAPAVQQAQPPQRPVGVGAPPLVNPVRAFIDGAKEFLRDGRELKKVADELGDVFGGGSGTGTGLGDPGDGGEPAAPQEPESILPFASEVVGGDGPEAPKLFGHPVRYTVDKESGKFDLKNFAFANPGLMEKGVEILGIAAEGLRNLGAKAAAGAGAAAGSLPAGVGQAPAAAAAQVVDKIPDNAQPAQSNGAGSASFPRV